MPVGFAVNDRDALRVLFLVTLEAGALRAGNTMLRATPGTLILVRDTEAQALAEEQDPEAIDALKALGYIGD